AAFDQRRHHPWRGYGGRRADLPTRERLTTALQTVCDQAATAHDAGAVLAPLVGDVSTCGLGTLDRGADGFAAATSAEWLPSGWLSSTPAELSRRAAVLREAAQVAADLAKTRADFAELASGCDPIAAQPLLAPALGRFSAWYTRLLPGYFKWK